MAHLRDDEDNALRPNIRDGNLKDAQPRNRDEMVPISVAWPDMSTDRTGNSKPTSLPPSLVRLSGLYAIQAM